MFKIILKRTEDNYVAYLLIGLIVWKWLSESVSKSSNSILSNINLIKKIKLNAAIFPVIECMQNTWKFLIVFLGFVLFFFLLNPSSMISFLYLPLSFLSGFSFILGVGLFLSSLVPFLPDLNFIINYGMKLVFYASAILFSENRIPVRYHYFVSLNPFFNVVKSFRVILLERTSPSLSNLSTPVLWGIALGIIGASLIRVKNREYPKLH